jgi:hypothetical protein
LIEQIPKRMGIKHAFRSAFPAGGYDSKMPGGCFK